MKKYILGIKGQMTQIFSADGTVRAATVITVTPNVVTQVKSPTTDGYTSVQIAAGTRAVKNITKPVMGHFKGLGAFRYVKEFRDKTNAPASVEHGATIDVSTFAVGDVVTVSATSKSKGFQGVVKRHNFSGDMRSHGRKHSERQGGSLGGGGGRAGGRVAKGKRMAGRMGGERVTVPNLTVLQVNPATNTLVLSGAVPGIKGGLVEIVSKSNAK